MKISVALAYSLGEPLTYRAPDAAGLAPGDRVVVPLGRRLALGWVVGLDSPYGGRLKDIIGIIADPFRPGPELMEFARRAAAAYFTSAGSLLDLSLPPGHKGIKALQLETEQGWRRLDEFSPSELERLAAAGPLRLAFKKPSPIAAGESPAAAAAAAALLLLGPGRDRAYRDACADALAAGGSVILVAPDIATARYWQDALPGVDPFHSGVTPATREKTWRQYRQGKSGIVCGGLAALALPLARPALLILDRAASPLYRRQGASPFRVDHLAEIRAATAGIPLLRGADGHTCATYAGRDALAVTDGRQERGITCQVHMLKGRERGIPAEIVDLVRDRFLAGRKTLVLVNRIQPVVHLFCPACGRVAACPRCGAPLGKLQPGGMPVPLRGRQPGGMPAPLRGRQPGGMPAPLQVDGEAGAGCRRCSFRRQALAGCPRCGKHLEPLHDVSIDSLARALERACGEAAVLALTAAELKDAAAALNEARQRPLVVATLAALSPHFAGLFASVVWVKPESFFGMEEPDAAEMIHGCGAEIAATLAPGGELHVFSVFHFHYALQHLLDEEPFFARELKYRQWFLLPPYAAVYELELRAAGLRPLAAAMRELLGRHGRELNVRRAYLASRRPQRGSYRGILELHAQPERIAAAGLHRLRRSSLRRVAG